MRRAFLIILFCFAVLTSPATAKLPYNLYSIKPLYNGDQAICTTWSLNKEKGLWVTAAHCVQFEAEMDGEWIWIQFADLQIAEKPVTIVRLDLMNDLALLSADVHVKALEFGKYPQVGDFVTVYGFPAGWKTPLVTWLHVSQPFLVLGGRYWMLLDGHVWPGHSGSPVLDKKGHVIAVVQAHGLDRFSGMTFTSAWVSLSAFITNALPQ